MWTSHNIHIIGCLLITLLLCYRLLLMLPTLFWLYIRITIVIAIAYTVCLRSSSKVKESAAHFYLIFIWRHCGFGFGELLHVVCCVVFDANQLLQRSSLHYRFRRFAYVSGIFGFGELFVACAFCLLVFRPTRAQLFSSVVARCLLCCI